MNTEIFVEEYRVDITADLSSLLTFALDDVKDFGSRQTSFSKTIVLPGTANNNRIFGHIFETGIANEYNQALANVGYNFNPAKSARCIIMQDFLQTFKGTIRMLEITKDRGRIEYEVALNGELTGLNVALSSGLLEDLDFSMYDVELNETNVIASWDNPGGTGVYFPLIDYGGYSQLKHNWDIKTFRPALYVREYIQKMFDAAGFRFVAPLFNTPRFKRLIIPHNQKKLTRVGTDVSDNISSTDVDITIYAPLEPEEDPAAVVYVPFETSSSTDWEITEDGGEPVYVTYVGTSAIQVTPEMDISGSIDAVPLPNGVKFSIIYRHLGIDYEVVSQTVFTDTFSIHLVSPSPITVSTGDIFFIRIDTISLPSDNVLHIDDVRLLVSATLAQTLNVNYGDTIMINKAIPKNIRQVDFLLSIVKLFNLYVYESRFDERLIMIAPFIDFYSAASANAVDWTYKMNRDKPIRIQPMSEINSKYYEFTYRDDSDYFNDLYKKRYNKSYGAHIYDSEFEFASQTSKLDLIFAPTPLVGYAGEDKIYPTIFKRSGSETTPVEEQIDSVIRIMQSKKITGVASWQIKNGDTVLTSVTDYGYAGHFDNPDNPGNDLNFGLPEELFFVLSTGDLTKTQFNVYWSTYMAEITDKDSKLVTARFYLTTKDIFELDFSKYVFVDGVLFRLNKIKDYNATLPSDCVVELLKVINTVYQFGVVTPEDPEMENALLWKTNDPFIDNDNEVILYK